MIAIFLIKMDNSDNLHWIGDFGPEYVKCDNLLLGLAKALHPKYRRETQFDKEGWDSTWSHTSIRVVLEQYTALVRETCIVPAGNYYVKDPQRAISVLYPENFGSVALRQAADNAVELVDLLAQKEGAELTVGDAIYHALSLVAFERVNRLEKPLIEMVQEARVPYKKRKEAELKAGDGETPLGTYSTPIVSGSDIAVPAGSNGSKAIEPVPSPDIPQPTAKSEVDYLKEYNIPSDPNYQYTIEIEYLEGRDRQERMEKALRDVEVEKLRRFKQK